MRKSREKRPDRKPERMTKANSRKETEERSRKREAEQPCAGRAPKRSGRDRSVEKENAPKRPGRTRGGEREDAAKRAQALPPKIRQMYRAVTALIEEGADINTIKVSDITRRAGIGKGTAYEYFSSKEEIIVGAILYDVERTVEEIEQKFKTLPGFREKFRYILDWVEENLTGSHPITPFLHLYQGSYRVSSALKTEMLDSFDGFSCVMKRGEELIRDGLDEGIFAAGLPADQMAPVVISSINAYVMYMNWKPDASAAEREQMKELLCGGLVRMLNPAREDGAPVGREAIIQEGLRENIRNS